MLNDYARVSNYQAQTGRTRLTDRQHRRVNKKRRHQSPAAEQARRTASEQRAEMREHRKARLAGLLSPR
ncbi:hypothetical protein GCM10009530_63140 [Microbispora corallina]|uniref:Uncharacterized protein n=1 Tax=Microbispora corallina TaxID=83302 RepID=A0ABQ4GBI2_9ACTN|nr:hypothetical protein [Microbispora corallina]GIH44456.1 hypothetical protein Mco01_74560 [Microbispora corallina]